MKLAASSGLPLPLYCACKGQAHSGRVRPGNTVVPLDTAVLVQLRMEVGVSSAATGSSGSAIFGNSLDFPIGSPLFNLPAGVTVNAPDSQVFDNVFAPAGPVPEPPRPWLLLAGGAALWLSMRRAAALRL